MRKEWFAISATAVLALGALTGVLSQPSVAVNESPGFSSQAWINAPKQPDWSRAQDEELFFKQYRNDLDSHKMNRSTVLNLLGTPAISYEYPRMDSRQDRSTAHIHSELCDYWALSNKKGYFTINYDKDGNVSSYTRDPYSPVGFNDLFGYPPVGEQPQATLQNAREVARCTTISEAEKLLGKPGKSSENKPPNFATPFRFSSYMWNVPGNPHQFIWVRTSGMFSQDPAQRAIDVVAILTVSPDFPISYKK